MTEITYKFDPYEDKDQLTLVRLASPMYNVLWDMDTWLRNEVKYGQESARMELMEEVREKLHEIMGDASFDLDCVS